ncbi:MAG: deoxyguanosinetriphosphate triphosphohydrolase [Candidatus Omnitrophica bacterium]|nr:deoxyguanosinetriphosphate triphosphohydrolase [Candidatus Omnitrophota bacterium]
MINRKNIEEREYDLLARYAMKSRESKGRVHKEKEHDYRSCYQRDKDRIIYSTAFRRLEYKTQVFVNHEGDYYRTRLTHTLEVAQVAKSISRALGLNEDLTESIALAHDLGHTPFGHAGEDTLRGLMAKNGGFEHNAQGLRVVDILEERYPDFDGLNLSYELREGIVKHSTMFDQPTIALSVHGFDKQALPLLEAQAVDIADEIAYDNHDLDDGITSGMIKESSLEKIGMWKEASSLINRRFPALSDEKRKYQIVRTLINNQITDLIEQSDKNIKKFKIKSADEARKLSTKAIAFGSNMRLKRKPLRQFLMKNLYQHYRVIRMSDKAMRFIKKLFEIYLETPQQLPPSFQKRLKSESPHRVICDYIAGMTDRYALDEYKKLFDPYEKV